MTVPAELDVDVVGKLARRCRCERPWEIATGDGPRCLKCVRVPAIRVGAAVEQTAAIRTGPDCE
jgi:hypothetical protein